MITAHFFIDNFAPNQFQMLCISLRMMYGNNFLLIIFLIFEKYFLSIVDIYLKVGNTFQAFFRSIV